MNIIRGQAKRKSRSSWSMPAPLQEITAIRPRSTGVMNLPNAIDACNDHGRVKVHTEPVDGKVLMRWKTTAAGLSRRFWIQFSMFFTTKPR